MRAIVNLALDALACTDTGRKKGMQYNQRIVQAMRLRYGLDDDRARTLNEVKTVIRWQCKTVSGFAPSAKCAYMKCTYCEISGDLVWSAAICCFWTLLTRQASCCGVSWLDMNGALWCEGLACAQVSEELKISKESVRQLVEEGKERLAYILAQEGLLRELQPAA